MNTLNRGGLLKGNLPAEISTERAKFFKEMLERDGHNYEVVRRTIEQNQEEFSKEFEGWFQDTLLNRTLSCNIRDVYRWSKDELRTSYFVMCACQTIRDKLFCSQEDKS